LERATGRDVPESCPVRPPGDQRGAPVGAEGHGPDPLAVPQGRADAPTGGEVPEKRLTPELQAPGGDGLTVGTEGDRNDLISVPRVGPSEAPRTHAPTAAGPAREGGAPHPAVGAERHVVSPVLGDGGTPDGNFLVVEAPHEPVTSAGHDRPT